MEKLKIFHRFETLTIWIAKVLMAISAVSLFAMMMLQCEEVFLRYVFNSSLIWPFEVIEFMMVGIAFLGLAYVQLQDNHIKVEFVFERMKPGTQTVTRIIDALAGLFFFILVTKIGWDYTWLAWTENLKSWSVSRIILWPARILVPLGSFALCLSLLVQLCRSIIDIRTKDTANRTDGSALIKQNQV